MKTTTYLRWCVVGLFLLTVGVLGCSQDALAGKKGETKPAGKEDAPVKKVEIAKNVTLEVQGKQRRVVVKARVCLRECNTLEELLTIKGLKEHEAVLAAEVDARKIHFALVAAGAEPGSPVQFEIPDQRPYKAAHGTRIKILLQYKDGDKEVTVPAQKWLRNINTKKDLDYDWVFGGSHLVPHPDANQPPIYEANNGDVICVTNFPDAMLDLPVFSPKDLESRQYCIATERVPAVGTPVLVILEPMPEAKKKDKK
jgi:hypothetical protein